MHYLRLLLLPLSWLYGCIIRIRNKAYDTGFLSSRRFKLPVISIGNLAVGGAGKSPMAEYIIRLLKDTQQVAVLSRGYGRKTKGFRLVTLDDSTFEAGDEPMQFRQKFKNITVAVSEKRVIGIEALKNNHDVIVLDDAYQHRAVHAGLNILLFDYTRLHHMLLVLPAGNLREPFSGRKRANFIVITKTPETLTETDRLSILQRIKPFAHQQLFFSYLDYNDLAPVFNKCEQVPLAAIKPDTFVFLITGVANPSPLVKKINTYTSQLKHYDYPDHHPFSIKNITKLVSDFKIASVKDKIIITTEKDAQRLKTNAIKELLKDLPVYYLPVTAKIHQPDTERFDNLIKTYATRNL